MSEVDLQTNSGNSVQQDSMLEAFSFTGSGGEFFRIWIVNVFLSIITLGIYSAWAKVRTKSYFYGNTHLQGNSFVYLASPIAILKGRAIVVAIFLLYAVVAGLNPTLGAIIVLCIMAIMPWLIVRSLRFNAINSAYRNVRFNFAGTWGEAALAFFVWPLLGVLTLGLLFPLVLHSQQCFLRANSHFGTSSFNFDAPVSGFYRVTFVALAILVLGVGLGQLIGVPLIGVLVGTLSCFAAFAYFRAHLFNITYAGVKLNDHGFEASMTTAGIGLLYFTNMLAMICTLGLFYPWARVRTARYLANSLKAKLAGPLDQFVAAESERVSALGEELGEMLDLDIAL